jgi:ribosome biogenesis GTPase
VMVVSAASASDEPRIQRRGINPRRIERYLLAVRQSGARPVIAVNKSDLMRDRDAISEWLAPLSRNVPVAFVSAKTGEGLDDLTAQYSESDTVALVGSSGVGKSALVERLLGVPMGRTGETRADDERGRHTTTARELFVLPGGGSLIDTPGMRELGLWTESAEVDEAFDEIGELARECRFRDCRHLGEPGCRVLGALDSGELDPARFESRNKLERELAFERKKVDPRLRREAKRALVRRARALKRQYGRDE